MRQSITCAARFSPRDEPDLVPIIEQYGRVFENVVNGRASDPAPWIEWLARAGFVAKGLLYATIGILAGCAGLGRGGGATDTRGAMSELLELPFGSAVLFGLAIGLVGYAIWRIVEGIADPERRGTDAKGLAVRTSFVARGLLHLGLAYSAVRAAIGHPSSGSRKGAQAMATAFRIPEGDWLVSLVAIAVGGFGIYQIYGAFATRLHRDVNEREVEHETGGWLIVVSKIGIAARGIVFVAFAWLLFHAGREHNPGKADSLRDALNALARLGRWPFVATAAGLIAYGAYQLLSARYRVIRTVGPSKRKMSGFSENRAVGK